MSHSTRPRVDRTDELTYLKCLIKGETRLRIALIHAESGMGKSELIRELISQIEVDLLYVVIDFKGGELGLADVLYNICDTLTWKKFPALATAIKNIVQPININIKDNIQIGQNEISLALRGDDQHTRELRRSEISSAFIADLRNFEQITIIFDVFERCDEHLKAWFSGVFLPAIHRSPKISVIIAGQHIPEKTQMWECEHIALGGIAPEHWQDYANAIGAKVSIDFIRGCCVALKGKCINIAQVIEEQRGVSL